MTVLRSVKNYPCSDIQLFSSYCNIIDNIKQLEKVNMIVYLVFHTAHVVHVHVHVGQSSFINWIDNVNFGHLIKQFEN